LTRNVLALLLLITSLSVQSDETTPWPFDGLVGVSGTFTSETKGRLGDTLRSSGRFSSLKPDHYLWDIQTPDSQMLVVNATGFWQVDRDLDVIILRDYPVQHSCHWLKFGLPKPNLPPSLTRWQRVLWRQSAPSNCVS